MPPADLLHRIGDLAQGRPGTGRFHGQLQQIAFSRFHSFRDGVQLLLHDFVVPVGAELLQTLDLRLTHGHVVHVQDVDGLLLIQG